MKHATIWLSKAQPIRGQLFQHPCTLSYYSLGSNIKICDSTYMLNSVCYSLWNLTIHQIQHQCEIWMPDHPNNPACIKCASLHNVKVGRYGTAKCQEVHFTWKHKIKCFYPMCHTVSLVLCHTGTRMQCRVWQNQVPSTFKEAEIQLTRCHYCFTSQNKGYTN